MNRIAIAVKSALGIAILAPPVLALAADAAPDTGIDEIVVTGVRKSLEESLVKKRESTEVVEVVSAEDIGKMPDKNVADSLARVPGVTTSSAGASEGGFDENDRVSMRGTNPSLTEVTINGHNVSAGDWFVLDQTGTVGRSVSFTLLPSEIVSQVNVNKSSSASFMEGGVAGTVDIITRKPLDIAKNYTLQASAGAVFARMPSKADGQFSVLAGWKNEANNFGILLQGFSENRHLRRDGVEVLGYEQILPGSAIAQSNPDLANVYYPKDIGVALFTQKRERLGGMIDVEFRPFDDLTFDLSGFFSRLKASNFNRNYLLWGTHFIAAGSGQAPDPGYTVQNGTLTSATFSPVAGTAYGVYDQISRPDEEATAHFVNLDTTYNLTPALTLFGQIGYSWGDGKTPRQDVSETNPGIGSGAAYSLSGIGTAPSFNLGATNSTTPFPGGAPVAFGWIFGDQNIDVKDTETWAKIDSKYDVDLNAWKDLKFGVRYEKHDRDSNNVIGQGPLAPGQSTAAYPTTWSNYPANFDTFGGGVPTGVWYWTPEQLAAYNSATNVNRDPISRLDWNSMFRVDEKDTAAYLQADFKGERWAANVGVRYVHTQEDVLTYTAAGATDPEAITTSAFGPFKGVRTGHIYNDVLPSANFKFDVSKDLVARLAAAETMARPDYSALAGFTSLSPPGVVFPDGDPRQQPGSGSGGNPDLRPIRSFNYDAGLEWYFAKRSLLSLTAFYMDLHNYVAYGSVTRDYVTYSSQSNGQLLPYQLTVPVNARGRVRGAEFVYQQAFTDNFGFIGNYTFADGRQTSQVDIAGDARLVGTSKNTYNVQGYFENRMFSARVAYTYRSSFYSGLDRNTAFTQYNTGSLSAQLAYTYNDNLSVTLEGQNLNNPVLKYYALGEYQPRAFYKNGAQYYLTVRVKL